MDTIDRGLQVDRRVRDQWNLIVHREVTDYNARLGIVIDERLILAMLWVESGGPTNAAWNGRVMQIGNPGDPGFTALRNREGAAELVVRADLLTRIGQSNTAATNEPSFNIQCGIAYLVTRMAISDIASIPDPQDTNLHTHTVQSGENASTIARREHTTTDEIRASNPGVDIAHLRPNQELRLHRATMGRRITGWHAFVPGNIATRYNSGDPAYAEKLQYVLDGLNRP
jgi:hypothetical protein